MGALDDAIREHLELKRKHGADEEEVARKEHEAERVGALPSDAHPEPLDSASELAGEDQFELEPQAQDVPEDSGELSSAALADADELDIATFDSGEPPAAVALPDELEPDEVLPEEALNPEPAEDVPPDFGSEPSSLGGDQPNGNRRNDDLLEETPDFLEDMPEQDRLWFEQSPPKDFDFDD